MLNNTTEIKSDEKRLELYSENHPFRLSLRISKFEAEAEYKSFIKNCEKLVRGSVEYKLWKDYIKDVLGLNSCFITEETMDTCTLETHHHVPTLYQVVKAVIHKKMNIEEPFSTFDVCLETIELHFQNKIGYVCLISSMHEKLHAGFLKIPKELIHGNYSQFISEYGQYLDDEDMNQIFEKLAVEEGNTSWSKDNYPGLVKYGNNR